MKTHNTELIAWAANVHILWLDPQMIMGGLKAY